MNKVLVVDNNPVLLNLMHSFLSRQGYEVVTAEDGLSVLQILKRFKPDVIFLDLVMPNIDGEKLCRIIRGTPGMDRVKIVILSGLAAELEINISDWGVNACMAKAPFSVMSKSILTLLDRLEQNDNHVESEVLGVEDIFPREITTELLSVKKHLEVIQKTPGSHSFKHLGRDSGNHSGCESSFRQSRSCLHYWTSRSEAVGFRFT